MNVRELLRDLNVPFREHGESPLVTEGWVGVVCPWCGTGTGKHGLGINLRTGRATCWKCGPHPLADALAELAQIPAARARQLAGGLDSVRDPDRPAGGKLCIPDGVGELLPVHRRYLQSRGFDPDQICEQWAIQGIGFVAGPLKWRIFIPIRGPFPRDGVLSWSTRAVGRVPDGERYRAASREESVRPRGELLYGQNWVKNGVVVLEGFFDVWAVGPGAVCTCGTGFSRAQVLSLSRYPVRAVCFDNEPAAQRRADQLADQLAPFPGVTELIRLRGAKDPAAAVKESPAELAEIRKRYLE